MSTYIHRGTTLGNRSSKVGFPPFWALSLFESSPEVFEVFIFVSSCLAGKENIFVKQAQSLDSEPVSFFSLKLFFI